MNGPPAGPEEGAGAAEPMGGTAEGLRALLFGDAPLEAWPVDDGGSSGEAWDQPWSSFVRARAHLRNGDEDLAVREWSQIANPIFGWESRHVLQAWRFLRDHGIVPDAAIASEVLGVVVEVPIERSHDALAAYADGSVRYLNHAGGASVVDEPPPAVAQAAAEVLTTGQALADQIGVWDQPARPPLPAGHTRLCMLTRGGLRFGQGRDAALQAQPGAAELFAAATALLVAVTALP